ncbi:MAG TPA: GntR family transcriptional regulator [Janthinobacterium sp.]|nr:GntR family transcriptional regulator [Janthinobacterium sp.]
MTRGKVAVPLDLPWPAALRDGGAGKQEAAYAALRDAILSQLLPAGSRLPSSRTLAERWQLSRGTVELVFDRLRAEAYVARAPGSGTRVCALVPERFLMAAYGVAAPTAAAPASPAARSSPETGARNGLPFAARMADPALFPMATWSKYLARALRGASDEQLCSADPCGAPALRARIADYLGRHRGIQCAAADVVITTGIRHTLDLVARAVLAPGDTVCVEDPGYPAAAAIFVLAGARIAPVAVDGEGIDCAALRAHAHARLAYVTPAHQSPLGVTMSLTRRLELLDWASAGGAWIVEDDYDSEFNYHSAPLAALKSLDRYDRVIYCGSFNKTLFVGMRVGYAVLPAALRERLLGIWQDSGRSVGIGDQLALAAYMADGAFLRHLRLARRAYQERRDAVLAILAAAGAYAVSGQEAGFHFVLWLPDGCTEAGLLARASAAGLALHPLRAFCREARPAPAIVVGYSALTLAQARFGARKLAALLKA